MGSWSGKTIVGYQIAEEIGRGGMATVYRAHQPQLERWVAIKILQAETGSKEFLARFRREAKAVAALRHPNILTIYDYGEEGGIAYIVMEYVAGGTLKAHLTGQPMEWPDAATLVLPIGRALAYAHSQRVVHRDVKPANVLLARPDWPLLADFGLVKLLGHTQQGITQPGISIGTPAYFAPEQAGGGEVDHRSDIYGMGIVLYELLTGSIPFKADSPIEMMLRRMHESPQPPRRLNPRITPQLEAVILRALARDPDARHPTMEAFVNDLARLPGATGRAALSTPTATIPRGATSRLDGHAIATGPRLVVMGTGATIALPRRGEVLIGRGDPYVAPPDVDLEPYGGGQAGVSRHHARLMCRPEGWVLEDLQSTNGTFINSVPIAPGHPARVRHGDVILCGQFSLVFCEE